MSQREDEIIQEEKKEESRVKSFHGLFYNLFLSFSSFLFLRLICIYFNDFLSFIFVFSIKNYEYKNIFYTSYFIDLIDVVSKLQKKIGVSNLKVTIIFQIKFQNY